MQVHDFELENIRLIDEAILNRKNYIFSNENEFDVETKEDLESLMGNIRKTFYEKKFTKKRIAELQNNGYIENAVYNEDEIYNILGAMPSVTSHDEPVAESPSWLSARTKINDTSSLDVENIEDTPEDESVLEGLDDDTPWWSDE